MGQHHRLEQIHLDHLVVAVVVATGPTRLAEVVQHGEALGDLAAAVEEQTTS